MNIADKSLDLLKGDTILNEEAKDSQIRPIEYNILKQQGYFKSY